TEVIVEKILEPHAGDEEKIPWIRLAALHGVFEIAIGRRTAILCGRFLSERPSLVKLLKERAERQALGPAERVIVLQESHSHHEVREFLAASRVGDGGDVLGELDGIKEARNGRPFLGVLVDHHGGADAAVRVAAAGERAPLGFVALHHVRESCERADERDGEPIASGFDLTYLSADVFREMRKRVALAETALRSDVFIATGERNRLEADESDLLG